MAPDPILDPAEGDLQNTPAPFHLHAADILENVSDAFVALDRGWHILYANRAACRLNQKPLEDFVGKVHWEEWPGTVGTEIERQLRRAMNERVAAHFENRYVSEPHDVWLELDVYPSPEGINLFYRDITGRKRSEEALRASERRFREVADAMPHIAWTTGPDGAVDYYNRRWYDYSGLTLEQTQGLGWAAVIHPDDLANAAGVWSAAIDAGTVSEVEYRLRRADGQYRLHLGRSIPVHGSNERGGGEAVKWVGTATDIEDRRLAEESLSRSQDNLRLAVEGAQIGTFYCEWPLDRILWNDTCKAHFFMPSDAEINFDVFYSLLHPDDREPTRQAISRALAAREGYNVEYRALGSEGQTRWINAVGRFDYGPDGNPTRFDGITLDITERKTTEEEIRRRAEREALLNQVSDAIRASGDPELIQETAAALVGKALGVDRCYFSVYDPQEDAVRIGRDWRRAGLPSLAGEYRLDQYQGYVNDLYANGTAVIGDALAPGVSPAVQRVLGGFGIRAFLAVPLFDGDKFSAALAASMKSEPRIWSPDEIALLEDVLAQTRTAVETAQARLRERRFVRDVLASVTEGKLRLCATAADLPPPLTPFAGAIPISVSGGLRDLRQAAYGACQSAGMSAERSHDLVTAASEAGMNAAVHAGTGTGQVSVGPDGTVQVRVDDQGSGISMENLPRATLSRGFSTKATLGHGLKMMLETADRLYLLTGPAGTTVVLEQERDRPLPDWL